MRVIAGSAKGRSLLMVKNQKTRPTADRVKESLFNIIGPNIEGARVLDLFAGIGNLGIEALSRGAAHVTFVESDLNAAQTITKNIERLGFQGERVQVVARDFRPALYAVEQIFDYIFADPPYDRGYLSQVAALVAKENLLTASGIAIFEHRKGEDFETAGLELVRQKSYGHTTLSFLKGGTKG